MRAILWAGCLALTGCVDMQITERQFIRPDAPGTVRAAVEDGPQATRLNVTRPDGARLGGVLVTQPGARGTILYFGGNMFHLDPHLPKLLPELAGCGANVAVFDYRGYGRSSGVPDVATLQGDALAVFDAVQARTSGPVLVHGQSLGSFVAAYVAQERPVRGAVLESTATNVTDLANASLPWYMKPFVRLTVSPGLAAIDNRTAAARFTGPALVIAGGRDKVTPPALGHAVYEAISHPDKRYLLLEEVGHTGALAQPQARASYCDFVQHALR